MPRSLPSAAETTASLAERLDWGKGIGLLQHYWKHEQGKPAGCWYEHNMARGGHLMHSCGAAISRDQLQKHGVLTGHVDHSSVHMEKLAADDVCVESTQRGGRGLLTTHTIAFMTLHYLVPM